MLPRYSISLAKLRLESSPMSETNKKRKKKENTNQREKKGLK